MADTEQKISELTEGETVELDNRTNFAADTGDDGITKKFTFTQIVEQAMTNSPLSQILPSTASSSNKLATESDVNNTRGDKLFASASGGNFETYAQLVSGAWYTGDGVEVDAPKPYQFAIIDNDVLHGGNRARYYYNATSWVFDNVERVNLTPEQQAALDSGVTYEKVEQLPPDGGVAANNSQSLTKAVPSDTDAGSVPATGIRTILQQIWNKIQGIRDNFARQLQSYNNVTADDTDAAAVNDIDTEIIFQTHAKKINGIRAGYARLDGATFTGAVELPGYASENMESVPLAQVTELFDDAAREIQELNEADPDDTDAGEVPSSPIGQILQKIWNKIQGIRDGFARIDQNLPNVVPDDSDVERITNTPISSIFSVLGQKINGVRNAYARKDGVTFTGAVALDSDAEQDMEAVTLQQLNAAIEGGFDTDQNLAKAVSDDTGANATGKVHLGDLLQAIWNKIQGIRDNFARKLQSYNNVTADDTDAAAVNDIDTEIIFQTHAKKINGIRGNYARLDGAQFSGDIILPGDATQDLNPVPLQQLNALLDLKVDLAQSIEEATPDDTDTEEIKSLTALELLQAIWNKIQGIRDNFARKLESFSDVTADDTAVAAVSVKDTETIFSMLARKINGIRGAYARKDGATFTGTVILAEEADNVMSPVPLQQVDDKLSYKVTGDSSSVADNLPIFDGTSGKAVKDSGYSLSNLVKYADIVNDLTTGGESVPGSAEQLKVLDAKIVQAMQQGVYRGRVQNALVSQGNTWQVQPGYLISAAGANYAVGDSIQYNGTDIDEIDALFVVSSVGTGGTVTGLTLSNPGSFNSDKTGIITPSGSGIGSGLKIDIVTAQAPATTLHSIASPHPNNFAGVIHDEGRSGAAYMWIMGDFNGDGIFNWVRGYPLGQVDRNFYNTPIVAGELATDAATDVKIGNRELVDENANPTLVAITAKYLTAWLQGIRDNLKALFSYFDSSGVANASKKWSTARNIALTGAVTGDQDIDGSANITLTTALSDSAVSTAKVADGAIADSKIGDRAVEDNQGNPSLVPATAKSYSQWLQGIRDNLKSLFEFTAIPIVTAVSFDNDTVELATIIYVTTNKNMSSIGMYTATGTPIPGVVSITGTSASFLPNSQGVFANAFSIRVA